MNKHYINEDKLNNLIEISKTCKLNLLPELISSYNTNTPMLINKIKVAASEENYNGLYKAAHSLKNSSAYLGADMITKISNDLEQTAINKTLPRNMQTVIKDLEHFFSVASNYYQNSVVA